MLLFLGVAQLPIVSAFGSDMRSASPCGPGGNVAAYVAASCVPAAVGIAVVQSQTVSGNRAFSRSYERQPRETGALTSAVKCHLTV